MFNVPACKARYDDLFICKCGAMDRRRLTAKGSVTTDPVTHLDS